MPVRSRQSRLPVPVGPWSSIPDSVRRTRAPWPRPPMWRRSKGNCADCWCCFCPSAWVSLHTTSRGLRRRTTSPQFLRCNSCAFGEGLELGPHDAGMYALCKRRLGEAAIGAAHDILLTDDLGKPDNALRHQFRMFDNVGGVADDAGNQHLAGRELDRSPDHPFVLMARIGGLELIGAHVHLQHEIDDVLHGHVEGMRAVPATPADVIARAFRREAPERGVGGG